MTHHLSRSVRGIKVVALALTLSAPLVFASGAGEGSSSGGTGAGGPGGPGGGSARGGGPPATAQKQPRPIPPSALQSDAGVLLVSIDRGGPADKAGIVRGDIVLQVNGVSTSGTEDLVTALDGLKAADRVALTIRHGDVVRTATATPALDRRGLGRLGAVAYPPVPGSVADRTGPGPTTAAEPPWRSLDPGRAEPPTQGVTVVRIVSGSPAERCGLKVGDVIESLDGTPVRGTADLQDLLAGRKAGETMALSVRSPRGAASVSSRELRITAGNSPIARQVPGEPPPYLGLVCRSGAPAQVVSGALVLTVAEGGAAAKAGLRPRDLITAVEGIRISSTRPLEEAIARRRAGSTLQLSIYRLADDKETDLAVVLRDDAGTPGAASLGASTREFALVGGAQGGTPGGQPRDPREPPRGDSERELPVL
jgi:S1-C subfamily serine protease